MTPIVAALGLLTTAALYTSGCSAMTGKSTGEFFDDATITTKEKAAMLKEGIHLNVDTNRGVVALNGTVNTVEEKARAEQIARTISGVQGVQNNLAVRNQTTP
jgi:osmotically-inducible protein OsmY